MRQTSGDLICIHANLYLLSLLELLFISVARGGVDGIGISETRNFFHSVYT